MYGPLNEIDALREKYSYEPDTGLFRYRISAGRRPGTIAGGVCNHRYMTVVCGSKRYQAHRVAWAVTHGRWPDGDIDHINHIRTDNRLVNLREATRSQNLQNGGQRTSKSGYRGVFVRDGAHKRIKKYLARITVAGKIVPLGNFADPAEAHEAYIAAAKRYFGEFAIYAD